MTNEPRILIPIDLHRISTDKLETLVKIASLLRRGVLGLILEDLQLQQVADLPFTTEVSLSTGRERTLLRDHLSRRGSTINLGTRKLLLEIAARQQVELSFEEACGHRLHCALERDGGLDVFFPARQHWQHPRPPGRPAIHAINRLLLVLPSAAWGQRVLAVADSLLRARLVGHTHAMTSGDFDLAQLAKLPVQGHSLTVQTQAPLDANSLLQLIKRSPYDLMLIPRACLSTVPVADLDAALAVASGQTMFIGDNQEPGPVHTN